MNPFRELFVEVAQALLEAAVIEAQQRQRPAQSPLRQQSEMSTLVRLLPEVFKRRYGWIRAVALRAAHDALIRVEGLSHCGHLQRVDIDDLIVFSVGRIPDICAIDRQVQMQRKCFCMHPEDM